MKNIFQLFHTYKQASWRTQLQWIGLFLAALASLAIVSAFYVTVTTRTALAGRSIAQSKDKIISIQHKISDLESELATLTSTRNMQERATALGFKPAGPEEFTYVYVSGFSRKTVVNLAPRAIQENKPVILPEYTESLLDWLTNRGLP